MSDLRPDPREPSEASKLVGASFIAVGALIATLCGLCSLGALGAMIMGWTNSFDQSRDIVRLLSASAELLAMIAILGGIPFTIGVALIVVGRKMRKRRH